MIMTDPFLESPELRLIPAPTYPKLLDLLARWQTWPRHGGLPGRAQFEPADMPHLLPQICLVEYDRHANPFRDYDILFRYIGSKIGDDFQMSRHTRQYMSDFGAPFAPRWFPVFDQLARTRAPVAVQGTPYLIDKTFMSFELLYLPLARGDATDPRPAGQGEAEVAFVLLAAHFAPQLPPR